MSENGNNDNNQCNVVYEPGNTSRAASLDCTNQLFTSGTDVGKQPATDIFAANKICHTMLALASEVSNII